MRFMLKVLVVIASIVPVSPMLEATSACTNSIVIGEGNLKVVTSLVNKSVAGTCLNDLLIDTVAEGANYGNHGEFVSYLSGLARDWAKQGIITGKEAGELVSAAARSQVGNTLTVRVIAFNDFHGNLPSPGT